MIIRVGNYTSFPNYLLIITYVIYFETCFRNIFKEKKLQNLNIILNILLMHFLILKFHER